MTLSLMGSHHNQSTVTREDEGGYTQRFFPEILHHELSSLYMHAKGYAPASSRSNHDKRERQRYGRDESSYSRKDENRRPEKYSSDYGSKRARHGRRTPGKSDWDDGRREWEDTARRGDRSYSMYQGHHDRSPSSMLIGASPDACGDRSYSMYQGHHDRSPSSMLIGASPDACLVSPRLGGNTPRFAESTVTREDEGGYTPRSLHGTLHHEGYAPASSRSNYNKRERQRYGRDESSYSRKDENRGPGKYSSDYGSKRTRHGRRTPGKSGWDDGRWEWEGIHREDVCHSMSRGYHFPSPSPMLIGASPDSWYRSSPSPVPIRASGSSTRRSDSCQVGTSHQLSFSVASSTEGSEDGRSSTTVGDQKFDTSELEARIMIVLS